MLIKELADATDTTVRTVRYYHQEGLLPVPRGRPRNYSFEHLVRLTRIRHLVDSGVPLAKVKLLIGSERVDIQAELEATKDAIDAHIAKLLEQRERITQLQQRPDNQAPSAIPLPQRVNTLYRLLLERADSERLRRTIKREQQVVEVLAHLGILDQFEALWPVDPSEDYLDVALRMFESFEHIDELSPQEAEAQMDGLIKEHVAASGFDPADIPSLLEKFLARPQALQLITWAYPHPNQKMFVRKFLTRYLEGTHERHHD